jgi:hypothetical protein
MRSGTRRAVHVNWKPGFCKVWVSVARRARRLSTGDFACVAYSTRSIGTRSGVGCRSLCHSSQGPGLENFTKIVNRTKTDKLCNVKLRRREATWRPHCYPVPSSWRCSRFRSGVAIHRSSRKPECLEKWKNHDFPLGNAHPGIFVAFLCRQT